MSQSSEKRSVQVKIFGTDYSLKADRDTTHVESIARYVDDKLQNLSRSTNVTSQTKIAVLTALNIADELFRLKKEFTLLSERLENYETRSKSLSDSVENGLNEILGVRE